MNARPQPTPLDVFRHTQFHTVSDNVTPNTPFGRPNLIPRVHRPVTLTERPTGLFALCLPTIIRTRADNHCAATCNCTNLFPMSSRDDHSTEHRSGTAQLS